MALSHRLDRIDANAFGTQLHGQTLGQHVNAALGHAISAPCPSLFS